ncbi:hypothetical protein RJ639_003049 [Escallonia herrerae]|uniref:Uncharacterized protein n=1 Tax=Escallonia herrerae TaxID=1293975 RepID=A0AA88W2Q2_9ASTE|nr:hypothetical protein RJ639_013282 [Escallonia herrerae]KAK3018817.1 hypothetical protein RJ639_003049 [Escallonia herrerae]
MFTRGIRASNSQPPSSSIACSNGSFKHKPETPSESLAFLTASQGQVSILHGDTGRKAKEESRITQHICKLETVKQYINSDNRRTASEAPLTPGLPATSISNSQTRTSAYKDKEKPIHVPPSITSSIGLSGCASGPGPEKVLSVAAEGKIQNLSSDMSLMSLDRHQVEQHSGAEKFKECLVPRAAGNGVTSVEDSCVTREQSDLRSDPQPQVAKVALPEVEEGILSFEVQQLKDPEVISQASFIPILSQSLHLSNDSRGYSPQLAYGSLKVNIDSQGVDKILNKGSVSIPAISNGYPENLASSSSDFDSTVQHSFLIPNDGRWKHASRFEDKVMEVDRNASVDMGESSIISNILSMDFDSWDESLTSPQNFAKLLGETDKQQGSLGASSSWKAQSNSQSRFSFAREEEYVNQVSHADSYSSNVGQFLKNHSLSHNFVNNGEFYTEKLANGFSSFNVEEPENFAGSSHSHMSSNKLSVSRAQISAPPGFSGPSRAPPPGFTFHERSEQPFEPLSGNHSLDSASFLRKPYQEPSAVNISSPGDIEFMDPAILAVGKGRLPGGLNSPGLDMRSNFPTQLSTYENEARLQLMQRSFSTHQNQRYPEMGDSFSPRTVAYGLPSRIMDQTMANNMSAFPPRNIQQSRNMVMSNGHWDSWNEVQSGHDLSMAELLRNERLGSNKYYTGYEDLKFRMPSSADFYNRSYGM